MRVRTKTIDDIRSRCVLEAPPCDPLASPVVGECWTWTGAKARLGYGVVMHDGSSVSVHRLTLALAGVDPGRGHVDHLCRNVACCNPSHLEPVSARENVRRGAQGRQLRERRCKTCGSDNGYEREWKGRSAWICRECKRARNRRYREQAA